MKQQDVNQVEWEKEANWTSRTLLGVYASKSDTRWIVPKPNPSMGWTINFSHPACRNTLIAAVVILTVLVAAKNAAAW